MSVFAFMTFFYSTIFYKLGSGPLWNTVIGNESKCCQKNWWVNLLLVNNYVNLDYNVSTVVFFRIFLKISEFPYHDQY